MTKGRPNCEGVAVEQQSRDGRFVGTQGFPVGMRHRQASTGADGRIDAGLQDTGARRM
jgi:hypothetical protein